MEGTRNISVGFNVIRAVPNLLILEYRVITDRYALPDGADVNACKPADQTWCGGTWRTIKDNLDYIQNAGFTAG